jgi:hypothetical protein
MSAMRLLLLLCACSNPTPSCNPPDGGTCVCTAADTFRDCTDKSGQPGLQFCASGMWSECAAFLDGGAD